MNENKGEHKKEYSLKYCIVERSRESSVRFYTEIFNSCNDVCSIMTTGLRSSLGTISLKSFVMNVEFPSLLITVSETRRPGPSVSSLCTDSLKNHLATLKGTL